MWTKYLLYIYTDLKPVMSCSIANIEHLYVVWGS